MSSRRPAGEMRKSQVQEELSNVVEDAEDALNALRIKSKKGSELLLDQATRLVMNVEGVYARLPTQEEKILWKVRVEELRRELQMATSCVLSASGTPSMPPAQGTAVQAGPSSQQYVEPQEEVGDIDDLFNGLKLNIPGEEEEFPTSKQAAQQGVPGRRFVKIVRSPGAEGRPAPRITTTGPPVDNTVGYDAVGVGELAGGGVAPIDEDKDIDEEAQRYPSHRPLRVELPVLPEVAAAAAAGAGASGGVHSGASQGSENSTKAQGGADAGAAGSDSDADSITSPEDGSATPGFH